MLRAIRKDILPLKKNRVYFFKKKKQLGNKKGLLEIQNKRENNKTI